MSLFNWKSKYDIGDATVDAQHQHLFELANQIVKASSHDETTHLLMMFYKHVREHFRAEETLMKSNGFPDYLEHRDAHNQMLDKLISLSDRVQRRQGDSFDIQNFVSDWILAHILSEDMALGEFLKQHSQAAPPYPLSEAS